MIFLSHIACLLYTESAYIFILIHTIISDFIQEHPIFIEIG